MEKPKCDIKKNICALEIMYPNTDASTACDEECYYEYAGTEKDIAVPVPKLNYKMKKIKKIKRKQ